MNYLLVGLGNIGPEYELTRHNIGFLTLDRLADKEGATWKSDRLAFKSEFKHKGRTIHLVKPTTYMNLSGKAVNYWMKTLNIPKENVLVLVDDVAIPFEKLRMRPKGSAAGHNGLKNIEETLSSQEYARLRMGIGADFAKGRQAEFVLSNFSEDEIGLIPFILNRSNEIIDSFCLQGIHQTMNKYNQ